MTQRDISVLHLEPTDVCQAACPACARETDPDFDQSQRHHLTVDQILQQVDIDTIQKLHKMFMCGNYGDPAAGAYTMEIYQWFRSVNVNIVLGMNTNGAIGSAAWWRTLAQTLCQPLDYVVFSIDGLEDTNSVYRVNVNWSKLMANAAAFIAAGGSAHWDMLVYQHNEHQVDACEQLARHMGFRWFRAKVSKRPLLAGLRSPMAWHCTTTVTNHIKCHALQERSMYIDAQGRVSPCCWLGSRQNDFVDDFAMVQQSWHSHQPHPVCVSTCGSSTSGTVFENQWRRQVELC